MEFFTCWNCKHKFHVGGLMCTYKPVGSDVAYDVCGPCWEELIKNRDED